MKRNVCVYQWCHREFSNYLSEIIRLQEILLVHLEQAASNFTALNNTDNQIIKKLPLWEIHA